MIGKFVIFWGVINFSVAFTKDIPSIQLREINFTSDTEIVPDFECCDVSKLNKTESFLRGLGFIGFISLPNGQYPTSPQALQEHEKQFPNETKNYELFLRQYFKKWLPYAFEIVLANSNFRNQSRYYSHVSLVNDTKDLYYQMLCLNEKMQDNEMGIFFVNMLNIALKYLFNEFGTDQLMEGQDDSFDTLLRKMARSFKKTLIEKYYPELAENEKFADKLSIEIVGNLLDPRENKIAKALSHIIPIAIDTIREHDKTHKKLPPKAFCVKYP